MAKISMACQVCGTSRFKVLYEASRHPFFEGVKPKPYKKIKEKFDLIYCKAVLEHIQAVKLFVSRVRKQLNPGGLFAAEVPRVDQSLLDSNIGISVHEHVNFFTASALSLLCEKNGLKVKKIVQNPGAIIIVCENSNPRRISNRVQQTPNPNRYQKTMEKFRKFLGQKQVQFFGASADLFSYLYTVLGNTKTRYNIYDNDKFKHGKYFGRNLIPIKGASEIKNGKIVIMPRTFAAEIELDLRKKKRAQNKKYQIQNVWQDDRRK